MKPIRALRGAFTGRAVLQLSVLVLAAALVGVLIWRLGGAAEAKSDYRVPTDPAMENSLGIRVDAAQLVAGDGIVEVRYTVLDAQKASKFQNDVHHPPVLHSERRAGDVYRTALMKQGHDLRPGQSYYVLYLNNANTIRRGDTIEIADGPNHLAHIPVR